MEMTCPHCGKRFFPHPAVLNQQYCGRADCQRARKRTWQKEKLKGDPDYRENQAAAQKAWQERNRGYWVAEGVAEGRVENWRPCLEPLLSLFDARTYYGL